MEAAGEALVLLRFGYASGALARWRLLREAEVLSIFIGQRPVRTAESFLRHSAFKGMSLRHDYQRWAGAIGEERLPKKLWHSLASESVHARISATGAGELRGFPIEAEIG